MTEVSALQKARYSYQPKLPAVLKNDLDKIAIKFGKATESLANQAELKKIFTNTYGKPFATFEKGENPEVNKKMNVGVILSGGHLVWF